MLDSVCEASVYGDLVCCELECVQPEAGVLSVLGIHGCPRP